MMTQTQDDYLGIDPREFTIEHYGHKAYYTTHQCPTCQEFWPCGVSLCRLAPTVECLTCLTRDVLSDTERFAKEVCEFLATYLPISDTTQSEIDGKLKGLAERSSELQKRMDSEVKA